MSDILKLMSFALIGIAIGLSAFTYLQPDEEAETVAKPDAEPPNPAKSTGQEEAKEQAESELNEESAALAVEMKTSRAFGTQRLIYAHFVVTPQAGPLDDVRLHVEPNTGVELADVYGQHHEERAGAIAVDFGPLAGPGHAVVELHQSHADQGAVTAHLTYQKADEVHVASGPVERSIAATSHDPAVEVYVGQAMTGRALERADDLRTEGEFDEALQVLENARAWLAEVGLALRVGGEFRSQMAEIRALRSDIEREKNRPRKKRAPKERSIAIMYGSN